MNKQTVILVKIFYKLGLYCNLVNNHSRALLYYNKALGLLKACDSKLKKIKLNIVTAI